MTTDKLLQLQAELHVQIRDGDLLDRACSQAKHYLAESYERHVAPSTETVTTLALPRISAMLISCANFTRTQ